jgi:hypothetical protein
VTQPARIELEPRADLGPPNLRADEKTSLIAFLGYLREALIAKTYGVADEALRKPGVPSGTGLLWLLKHMAAVERGWFVWGYQGAGIARPDHGAAVGPQETAAALVAAYRNATARSNIVIADCDDLDRPGLRSLLAGPPPSMRWLLLHMIEETARHAGHADILRERIDQKTGR